MKLHFYEQTMTLHVPIYDQNPRLLHVSSKRSSFSTVLSTRMDSFCGSDIWSSSLTWDTKYPEFTECFHQTALVWIPCGFIWLMAPFEMYRIATRQTQRIPWSSFNISKSVINLALIGLALASVGYSIYQRSIDDGIPQYQYDVYLVSPIILAVTLILTLVLMLAGKKKGIRSSGSLFLFWLLLAICGGFTYANRIKLIMDGMISKEEFSFVWNMIYYPLVVIMFFINCFADVPPVGCDDTNVCPEGISSFLSFVTYYWFDSMAWKGYKKPLEPKDLWDLNERDKSENVVPKYDQYWGNSIKKAMMKQQMRDNAGKSMGQDEKAKTAKEIVSILPAMCKAFAPEFLLGALFKLIQDLLAFVSPQILSLLIAFVTDPSQEGWKGYLYTFVLTGTAIIQTLFNAHYYQMMFVVGMQIRTSLVSTIYRKAIKISNSARKESTVGEIVNLMSVDAQRFMDLTNYINLLWSAPLQIGLSIYFLYQILGPSVFSGLAVMIVLIPINGYIAGATRKVQSQQMTFKDKRVKMMNEILNGMKVLKLYAWEQSFERNILSIRQNEVKVLKKAAYLSAGTLFLWTCAPYLVSLMSFMTFVLASPDNILTPDIAFVSLTLFNIMRMPMTMLPMVLIQFVQAQVSLKRVNKFMNADELDPDCVTRDTSTSSAVTIEKGQFAWGEGEPPTLKDINVDVEKGKLVAVVGTVGAGKSSLVHAMLGEMEKLSGRVNINGRLAYVPQQAWIQNCTLKDNILFGKKYDEAVYNRVIEACALKPDLAMLPGGDATEIGEKGINVSGGQKQRISIARAVYSDMDIFLLDDPLSAVDSHVGKHIFDKVLGPKGMLAGKTRVLVTHGITFLPQVDQIVVLKDGVISEIGSYKELLAQKGAFADFLMQHLEEEEETDEVEIPQELNEMKQKLEEAMGKEEFSRRLSRQRSRLSESQSAEGGGHQSGKDSPNFNSSRRVSTSSTAKRNGSIRRRSSVKDRSNSKVDAPAEPVVPRQEKLIEAEKTETGKVKWSVYIHYARAVGPTLFFWSVMLYVMYQAFSTYSNVWLSEWSASNSSDPATRDLYLGVYGGLGLGQAIFMLGGAIALALGTLYASQLMHDAMLSRIMHCPMSFFDTTPIGRIVNRFAKDVDTLDNILSMTIRTFLTCLLSVISTILLVGLGSPIFFALVIPIGALYYWIQSIYVASSRQLKRLESVSRSPIYSHFGETLTGATVIRAYGEQMRFIKESEKKVDTNQICYYPSIIANRWLSVRLESIGTLVVLFASLLAVIGRDTMDPGLVGLSISNALTMTQTLTWFMRMTSELETNIVAVERMKEYCETVQEASFENGKRAAPKDWPLEGKVSFSNYQVRYREGLDLVLKGITCDIQGGEKVGIVGRTGAGKSSLTLGLFRIIEAAGGSIVIDGIDIADLGLYALRSRLTIIPQDPVLFSGSLRMNFDPFNNYTDDEVWSALEHAHLKDFVKSLPTGLLHEASEGGENLSVGQRQLICLARALLRKTKVLILDEATAAVDLETDDLIQATIRTEFKECTVITIAHRLNTILDSNRVMVLDQGQIREFAPPSDLLADKQSIFHGMARDAGLV